MNTYSVKAAEKDAKWLVVDAEDKVLGRLASEIASVLKGKRNPKYTPHMDMGDNVIVVNAEKVKLTGKKAETKTYFRHSTYAGGGKTRSLRQVMERDPAEVIRHAVKGMLPNNSLGRSTFRKLHVYTGSGHPHVSQAPRKLEI
ncbi:MAG: 50S ribosomal protein L13 [Fibrobacterota bacterium]